MNLKEIGSRLHKLLADLIMHALTEDCDTFLDGENVMLAVIVTSVDADEAVSKTAYSKLM